jgi:hypothetical protein
MRNITPDPENDTPGEVPTIEEERYFLAQCDYINRTGFFAVFGGMGGTASLAARSYIRSHTVA